MPWFPKFEAWQAGALAAALVIPALLVLYFLKLRRKEVPVASTLLWRKAILDLQVNAPFQKLRRNLLLLLQLILLLLLLLALARPVSNYVAPPGQTTAILIDRSASMAAADVNGKSRLEEAKIRAKELIDAIPKNGTAMVVAFDDRPEMMQGFTADPNQLKQAVDRIAQTDRRSDINLAYQLANAQAENFDPEQQRSIRDQLDVRVYSDGRLLNAEEATVRGEVHPVLLGSNQTGNVAVVAMSAKRNYERPTQVQVFARLANFGPAPVAAPVRLSIDGEPIDVNTARVDDLTLLPERWTEDERAKWEATSGKKRRDSVDFKLELARGAVVRVEHQAKQGDALPIDDFAQIVVPPPKTLSVLLVTDGNLYLTKAVGVQLVKSPDVTGPADYEQKKPTTYDVVIFDNYKPTFLPEAGNFIWFGQVPDGIKTKVATDAPPAKPGQPQAKPGDPPAGEPVMLEDVYVLDWKRDHPILEGLALRRIFAGRALKLVVPLDREVLVDGLKGPLVVLDREAKRTHLIVAFDSMQSNWPFYPSFPQFFHKAFQFMAVGEAMDVRQTLHAGEVVRVPRSSLQQAGAGLKKVAIKGPGGSSRDVPVPEAGEFVLPSFDKVGLYATDPPIPGFEQMAVNVLDANESNVLPADKVPAAVAAANEAGANGGPGRRRLEWWWWLALAALGVLTVEWWVYTRRVHL
jgi:hypothetical protein